MIKHIYLYKLRDKSQAGEIAAKLMTMKDHIPSVYDVETGIDFVGAGSSFLTSAGAAAAAAGDGDTAASSAVAETGSSEKHSVSARRKLNTRLFMG